MSHIRSKVEKVIVKHSNPARALALGFAVMIAVGTCLLCLPAATRAGTPLSFISSLFTATSAVCVTGLSVFDPGSTLSLFGQIVLLVLIQAGGLGFMTITSFIFEAGKRRFSLEGEALLRESLNADRLSGLSRMASRIVRFTALCEGAGALLFMISFIPRHGVAKGVFISVFHSVSSFCNAGFDVLGNGTNLIPYAEEPLINIVTIVLVVLGGLGFFVIFELWDKGMERLEQRLRPHRAKNWIRPLSLHTKVVLALTGVLLAGGFVTFLIAEGTNPVTLGKPEDTLETKILGALFQSASTRTAGFMTIPQGDMRDISKVATVLLMFIGASPAGTGGGLKTTTAAVVGMFVWSTLKGRKETNLWKRRLAQPLINRAVAMFVIGVLVIVAIAAAISVLEPQLDLGVIIFETTSAFGTVGLSEGVTSEFSTPSLALLIVTMFGGRVGFFTLTIALAVRMDERDPDVRYPHERVIIG